MATFASLRNSLQTLYGFTIISKHSFIYTLELDVDLLELNPLYVKEPKDIGDIIVKARLEKKLQAKELANLIGVDPASIKNWERCNIMPSIGYVRRLEEALDVKFPSEMIFPKEENNTTLGEKIKHKRLELRLTQKELAERLGITAETVSDWEQGSHKPVGSSLEKLKDFMG